MLKINFFSPVSHVDSVKTAMFNAGAGRIGDYDQCCWQILGQGQFRPREGSQPYLGSQDTLETVDEYRVEMVCNDHCIKDVIAAMKSAHPYEEPAYDVIKVLDL